MVEGEEVSVLAKPNRLVSAEMGSRRRNREARLVFVLSTSFCLPLKCKIRCEFEVENRVAESASQSSCTSFGKKKYTMMTKRNQIKVTDHHVAQWFEILHKNRRAVQNEYT